MAKMITIHFRTNADNSILCDSGFGRGGHKPSNSNPREVTCKRCLRKMNKTPGTEAETVR